MGDLTLAKKYSFLVLLDDEVEGFREEVCGRFVGSPDDELVNAETQWRRNLFCFRPKYF